MKHITLTKSCLFMTLGLLSLQGLHAEDNWKFTLKNAYIDRDFDNTALKDTGSWSQGASLFYNSDFTQIPSTPLEVGVDASVQYAVRLSNDKHVADTVLPFDSVNQTQADDFLKYGGTLKLKYDDNILRVGELWLDLPSTSVDASRQLLASYLGANIDMKVSDKLKLQFGQVTKVSPRNAEGFQKFTYTANGIKHQSDGLNYFDARYQFNDFWRTEYYFANLMDLYNKHYLGIENKYPIDQNWQLQSKFKYFYAKDDHEEFDVESQNIGFLETLKYKNHSFSLGFQRIIGDTFPLPDGFLPELYFINWNVSGFFKENERSYHFVYAYDFKDYVPGLNTIVKYSYGDNIPLAKGGENTESEWNVIANYNFQQPMLKGWGLQYLYIKYDIDQGTDFDENRFFVNYTKKF